MPGGGSKFPVIGVLVDVLGDPSEGGADGGSRLMDHEHRDTPRRRISGLDAETHTLFGHLEDDAGGILDRSEGVAHEIVRSQRSLAPSFEVSRNAERRDASRLEGRRNAIDQTPIAMVDVELQREVHLSHTVIIASARP